MSFEKQMYEVQEKWEESYFSAGDSRRVKYVSELIANDVSSILDVGCGNGILVNYLDKQFPDRFSRICGTDRSETSLKFVHTEKVCASIDQLPFKDGEFDLVTCLEVIEHLPQEIYFSALAELKRIASQYIIISVPNEEDLVLNRVTCPKCYTAFSPFYHMRSFSIDTLSNCLLPEFESVHMESIEKITVPRFPRMKQKISRFLHPEVYPPNCICPMCGHHEFDKLKKTVSSHSEITTEEPVISGLSRFWPHTKKSKWIVGLFKRK